MVVTFVGSFRSLMSFKTSNTMILQLFDQENYQILKIHFFYRVKPKSYWLSIDITQDLLDFIENNYPLNVKHYNNSQKYAIYLI